MTRAPTSPTDADERTLVRTDVLILDDDDDSAQRIAKAARRARLSVTRVDGFHALAEHLELGPRTLVLDLMLGDVDGIEVIRYVAQMIAPPDIVIVTELDPRISAAARRLARAKGITVRGMLNKPWQSGDLHDALLLDIDPKARRRGRAQFVPSPQDLRMGIANGEIEVLFQPKIDVQTLELVSVEALARWSHPEHGPIGAEVFVRVAERHNLIGPLTDAVVRQAFLGAAACNTMGLTLRVSINISGASLANLSLPDHLHRTAAAHGLSPSQVIVEITESWIAQNPIDALDILTRMRMKGFELAIDDYGTGYSSVLRLKQVPFSELKLDKSLIRGAAADEVSRVIVSSSIELGQKLGMRVVAEGVDNQDDWDLISDLGCDQGQGFFIARPLAFDALPDWLGLWRNSLGATES